jgi:ribosome-associated toxin RatA of RatAB toxin-antitoxin module
MFLGAMPGQLLAKIKEFTDTESLITKIEDLINGIDEDAINGLFEKLSNVFNIDKLQDEKGELKLLLNQTKDLVK